MLTIWNLGQEAIKQTKFPMRSHKVSNWVSEEVPSEMPIEALDKTSGEVSNESEADSD